MYSLYRKKILIEILFAHGELAKFSFHLPLTFDIFSM